MSLADHLADVIDENVVREDRQFVVDDIEKANWAMRKIAQHQARLAEVVADADRQRAVIDAWVDDARKRCDADCAFLETLLVDYHHRELEADDKRKTIRLVAGVLEARALPMSVDIVDQAAFEVWVDEHELDPPLVRVKIEPDKTAIKAHIKTTGEIPAGVDVHHGDVRFSVKPQVAS